MIEYCTLCCKLVWGHNDLALLLFILVAELKEFYTYTLQCYNSWVPLSQLPLFLLFFSLSCGYFLFRLLSLPYCLPLLLFSFLTGTLFVANLVFQFVKVICVLRVAVYTYRHFESSVSFSSLMACALQDRHKR